MENFEELLYQVRGAVERFVFYRLPSRFDAEDVLQEVFLTAQVKFGDLRDKNAFRAWILTIAKHKCVEYFRAKAKAMDIPLDEVEEHRLAYGWRGIGDENPTMETLEVLAEKDKQILYLYFFQNMAQADIAKRLGLPLGTVKSRMHAAKEHFREKYPYPPGEKGESGMKKLPEILPEYRITPVEGEPFAVRHEELPGMMIVPRLGEKVTFGSYDFPERKRTDFYRLEVMGEIAVHGVRGVEIRSEFFEGEKKTEERRIFAQLTEEFCRYLGGMSVDGEGVRWVTTFLDEDFVQSYNIGEDNCGFSVERVPQGKIVAQGTGLKTAERGDVSDIVGRFTLEMGGKIYDTVRLIDLQQSGESFMLAEYYLDRNGRTVLWRRFNRDDWKMERYGQRWTEKLPENERLTVNGEVYVHWYDCICDSIL